MKKKKKKNRHVQIERICRRQNKCDSNIQIYIWKGRKDCGKIRKCWLQAFSPFPTIFQKVFFPVSLKIGITDIELSNGKRKPGKG